MRYTIRMESKSRGLKLLKNMGIYALGSISSKLIMFLLVPIYSFYIDPTDFGYYDICFIVVTILLPFITMQLRDGVFRFLVEEDEEVERKRIITFAFQTLLRHSVLALFLAIVVSLFTDIKFVFYVTAFAISFSFFEVVSQMARGVGRINDFVISGILCSFSICIISILLVVVFQLGIIGIFLGNILGRFVAVCYLELRLHFLARYFDLSIERNAISREIRNFCLPLVGVTLLLLVISSSNRFFIEHFVGLKENGLFAVSQKFAAILETLAIVFYQAWQESTIRQYKDVDRNEFYSRILNTYVWFLSSMLILVSFGTDLFYPLIVGSDYQESSNYLYLLLSSSVLVSLCFFFEAGYQCVKKTSKEVIGLAISATISIAGNFFLSQLWGIYGILATLVISYIILLTIRYFDTKSFWKLQITQKSKLTVLLAVTSGFAFYYLPDIPWIRIAYLCISVIFLLILMPQELKAKILHQ